MRAWWVALGVCGVVVGCGYNGDSSLGELGNSTWRIDDGLCPGTEGGCAMETPVAAGVLLTVDANVDCARRRYMGREYVTDCDLLSFDVAASGAVEVRDVSYDAEDARIDLEVLAVEAGEGAFELRDADGGLHDRVAVDVREAAALECGRVGARGAAWDMRSLDTGGSYQASTSGVDRETDVELGCRLLDARGAPLFAAAAIEWRIVEGADIATVDDGGLFGDSSAFGSRVYVRLDGRGTIRLDASFEDMTQQLEVVVD